MPLLSAVSLVKLTPLKLKTKQKTKQKQPQNPSLGAATTVSTFLTCWTLLMWHRDGLPVEPGYQVTEYMQTAHSSEHETEEDAFSSALSAAGMHPSTTELHANV